MPDAYLTELARLRAENAALRTVVDAAVQVFNDLEALTDTVPSEGWRERIVAITDCLAPLADALDGIGDLADGGQLVNG